MDSAEQQYQRDIARIEAHKLALKDDEFRRVSELVKQETREHTRYHQQRGAAITLNDRDSRMIYVSTTDGHQVVTISFNEVRHEVDILKTGGTLPISYLFAVNISNDKPIIVGTKWKTEPLGVVTDDKIITAIRNAVDALLAS